MGSSLQAMLQLQGFRGTEEVFLPASLKRCGRTLIISDLTSLIRAFVELRALFQLVGEVRPGVLDGCPHLLSGQVVHLNMRGGGGGGG